MCLYQLIASETGISEEPDLTLVTLGSEVGSEVASDEELETTVTEEGEESVSLMSFEKHELSALDSDATPQRKSLTTGKSGL